MAMVLRVAPPLTSDRMSVVEPNQSLAVRPVQRERVVQPMRLLRRRRYACHHEPDPVTALGVHHEDLPVEVKEHVKGWITWLRHGGLLSY
jgi:hypothetical protein